jgi:predicted RNA-binding protein with PIN domain
LPPEARVERRQKQKLKSSHRLSNKAAFPGNESAESNVRARYLIVDGHSVIFAWPELRDLHGRRSSLARETLIKQLCHYQDWTGVRVVVVFDGRGPEVTQISDPGEIQIFYSRDGQPADALIERLAAKYAANFELTVATSDSLERETVTAFGAGCISPDGLRALLEETRPAPFRS